MRYLYRFHKPRLTLFFMLMPLASVSLWAQSALTLDRVYSPMGGMTFHMNVASAPGSVPAGLQWTLSYSPVEIAALSVEPGPALVSAGKTLFCRDAGGSVTCLATGLNTSAIADGNVAIVNLTLAPGTVISSNPLTLGGTFGVLPEGWNGNLQASADSISLAGAPATLSNLALGKPVAQSSTYPFSGALASLAVDGNTDGNFYDGSVTATNADPNAWWQVDLGFSANITSLAIWNRTDCCASRLNDYWVFISDTPFLDSDTPATLGNRAGTWSSHQTAAPTPFATIAAGMKGRYVRIQLSDLGSVLSLAEVRVMGTAAGFANLSQGKPATQSSTLQGYAGAVPESAVDGITAGDFFSGSVTATDLETNPWWQVDLGAPATVGSVVLWNRTDCCASRLANYWVFVSNTPFSPSDTPATLQNRVATFSSYQASAPNPTSTITVGGTDGFSGRYVRVQLADTGYLSLAEVQVFGQVAANLAQPKTATAPVVLAVRDKP